MEKMEGGCSSTTANSNDMERCPETLLHAKDETSIHKGLVGDRQKGDVYEISGSDDIFLTWSQVQIKSLASISLRGSG
jgi:hypothetical protein